jgi:ABC-type lipoprotein release transport system permease subunit
LQKQKDPPIRVAIEQAIKGIRVRLSRQISSGLGVLLGIAFFSSVKTSQLLSPANYAVPASLMEATRLQWLAILSLLMCFVGITNAMLMSVTERYKEIGTLKCLGSTDRFIVTVFFVEAIVLGVVSSLAGSCLGFAIITILRLFTEGAGAFPQGFWNSAAWILILSTSIGVLLSAIAAVAPAIQAARMPAAAALRVEI